MASEEQHDLPDDDDDDEGDREEEEPLEPGLVTVERLTNIDDAEMYRLFDEEERRVLGSVALRPMENSRAVEYGVWRRGHDDEQPGATGGVEWQSLTEAWDDAAREDTIRQIVYRYEEDIGVAQERLAFRFEGPPPDDEEDEEQEDEDEEGDDRDADGDRAGEREDEDE